MRVGTIAVSLLLFAAGAQRAIAEPPISADEIDRYLSSKRSPIEGRGAAFLRSGIMFRVDPRLVVAIAGQESTFGRNLNVGAFNAWGWMHHGNNSPFNSWEAGIYWVTRGLRKSYLDASVVKVPTISGFVHKYCDSADPDCAFWVRAVTQFYHDDLGGDLSNLGYSEKFWTETTGPDVDNTVFIGALVTSSNELWASTNRGCFDHDALGVLRSTDRGLNWASINFGFFSTNVRTLMLIPSGDLFAGVHNGVYRFDRTFGAWNPSGLAGVDVNVLRATTRGLWASDSCFCTGVRQSTDNGQTWQRFDTGLPPCVNAIVQNPVTGDLYAGTGTNGVYWLPVGAVSWSPVNEGLGSSDLHSLAVNASGDLFAGTIQGLFQRKNGHAEWTSLTEGLPNDGIQSIAIAPQGTIFVGTFSHGVYFSAQNDDTWEVLNSGITDVSRPVGAIAFDSQGFVYASVGSIVYRSLIPVE